MTASTVTEAESSRIAFVASELGLSRRELTVKVCQLKSFLEENRTKAAALKRDLMAGVSENFQTASSFMKIVYGVTGIVSIAFAIEVATGATALLLLVVGLFLLFVGLAELKRLLKDFWAGLRAQMDEISLF